ncbi:hypothetical protein BDZ97DRAFT_1762098 [Flammula alnicola]|nr:hypothetical protein BDZ97DRAFT_1762098 [Flammula alnicola]
MTHTVKKRAPPSPSPEQSDSSDFPESILLLSSQLSKPKKRSAPESEGSSEVEIVEKHTVISNSTAKRPTSKRPQRNPLQMNDGTVVITSPSGIRAAAASSAKRLSFGSFDADEQPAFNEESALAPAAEIPTKRLRKPSRKAAYMAEDENMLQTEQHSETSRAKTADHVDHGPTVKHTIKQEKGIHKVEDCNSSKVRTVKDASQAASKSWDSWDSEDAAASTPKPSKKRNRKQSRKDHPLAVSDDNRSVESHVDLDKIKKEVKAGKRRAVVPSEGSDSEGSVDIPLSLQMASRKPRMQKESDSDVSETLKSPSPVLEPAKKKTKYARGAGVKDLTASAKKSKTRISNLSSPASREDVPKKSLLQELDLFLQVGQQTTAVPADAPLGSHDGSECGSAVDERSADEKDIFEIPPSKKTVANATAKTTYPILPRPSFNQAIEFSSAGFFVNPSRADIDATTLVQNRAVHAVTRQNTVFIFNGGVASCSIIDPAFVNQVRIRCISLFPMARDYEQWLSFIASLYKADAFIGYVENKIVTICSRKEGAASGSASQASFGTFSTPVQSPKKRTKYFADVEAGSGTALQTSSMPLRPFPSYLNFEDGVKIYDARKQSFKFTSDGMADLQKLLLYQKGLKDLPEYSIVSVGYTLSAFPYSRSTQDSSSTLALSLNLQFVVLHGILPN